MVPGPGPVRLSGSLRYWNDGGMKLGILCGGGPAPGMNSVISAATIEARNSGWDVLGIMDGFEHLIEGRIEQARPLSITVAGKNIGYELRCAPPIPFDIEYTRDLGYS